MTDQAGLGLLESQDEQHKGLALRGLSLSFPSPPARSLTAATHSDVPERPRNGTGSRRLRKAHRKIAELRETVVSNRLRLKEKRHELREERTHANDLDAQFIRAIRQFWEHDQTVDKGALAGLYQEVQAARDLLGPMEDDYNQEEDANDAAEFDLNDQEGRFYSLYPANVSAGNASPDDRRSVPSSFSSVNSLNDGFAATCKPTKPALEEYVSRVGDANIIKERLEDLRLEREQYLEEERLRDRVNLDLCPPDQAFLNDFHKHSTELVQELNHILTDVQLLRQKAFEEGSLVPEPSLPAVSSLNADASLNRDRQHRSMCNESPALFTEHQSDGVVPNLRNDFASTRARINRWILDTLNNSPVERAHHKAILMAFSDRYLDNEAWARLVFEYWRRDQAAVSQPEDPANNDGIYAANVQRQDLKLWTAPIERYYVEETPSEDSQLYVGGNPLLRSRANPYVDVDLLSLLDTQFSESDLYSPFVKSQSV